jgi:predicted O-methyltransferase YrrM
MSRNTSNNPDLTYIRNVFAPEDGLLQQIDATIIAEDLPIHISAEEGKLLHMLARMVGAKKIVEVGTLAGYSAVWMARALPNDGKLYTIDADAQRVARTKKLLQASDVAERVELLEGKAVDVLREQLTERAPFDMMFIDADKISYPLYLDWAEKNVRSGGLIVGDNTLLHGAVSTDVRPEKVSAGAQAAMREFNQRLADPQKFCSILLPSQDGITIAMKL